MKHEREIAKITNNADKLLILLLIKLINYIFRGLEDRHAAIASLGAVENDFDAVRPGLRWQR